MNTPKLALISFAAILVGIFCIARLSLAQDADKKHHTVVEVSTGTAEEWNIALSNVENLRTALGPENTEVEVVCDVKAVPLLVAKGTPDAERIKKLADAGVVFAACRNSMQKFNVTKEDLLPECITVDAGVAEVVRKQEAHWTFLKPGT